MISLILEYYVYNNMCIYFGVSFNDFSPGCVATPIWESGKEEVGEELVKMVI